MGVRFFPARRIHGAPALGNCHAGQALSNLCTTGHLLTIEGKRAKRGLLPTPSMDRRLAAAASRGRAQEVQRLVQNGADVNSVDSKGETRASGAAGRRGGGKQLTLGRGSTHECCSEWAQENCAAAGGSRCKCGRSGQQRTDGCVRGRGRWGGEGAQAADTEGGAALIDAAQDGHKDTVQLLVALGANVNKADNDGGTGA